MQLYLALSCLLLVVESKIHIFESKTIPAQRGTRIYFLTNGNEEDLRDITIKAEKSQIDTNVSKYSVPQVDGSLNPLTITADNDTVVITRPVGNTTPVTVYQDRITDSLNVFPVFSNSAIQFKSGKNVFFAVDKPNGKIITIKNLKVDRQNNGFLRAYSGVPGDLIPSPYLFFSSDLYDDVNFYQQLDIPLSDFSLDVVFSGVTTISDHVIPATTTLQSAGLVMSPGFPTTMQPSDVSYTVRRTGDELISLHMNPFFYREQSYMTDINVKFGFGVEQGNSFPSELNGRLSASGAINSVEVKSIGAFAIQYYTNSTATGGTVPVEIGTTPSVQTTTKSSYLKQASLSFLTLFVSLLLR
ncbi:hypothetical protein GCK72_013927 [Caenorhabditis remanei]|uniref:CUB-like domain-containing protein n=1 Tax=Caenorhabditis remanei TaxID=31234 RepID=A0A6A5GS11_CAERE|nr:hypothetical protein GCK72_013927 [Caenorhabditis remanei]KAF1757471.1 hypothetical protein GCK72_013927 [Caenorhabditis remanei]